MTSDREGLIARIRQIRHPAPARDRSIRDDADLPNPDDAGSQSDRLTMLESRVARLEGVLEGLQDSVYRESERHAKLIADLQSQIQPAAMRAALAEDARNRGL